MLWVGLFMLGRVGWDVWLGLCGLNEVELIWLGRSNFNRVWLDLVG